MTTGVEAMPSVAEPVEAESRVVVGGRVVVGRVVVVVVVDVDVVVEDEVVVEEVVDVELLVVDSLTATTSGEATMTGTRSGVPATSNGVTLPFLRAGFAFGGVVERGSAGRESVGTVVLLDFLARVSTGRRVPMACSRSAASLSAEGTRVAAGAFGVVAGAFAS